MLNILSLSNFLSNSVLITLAPYACLFVAVVEIADKILVLSTLPSTVVIVAYFPSLVALS